MRLLKAGGKALNDADGVRALRDIVAQAGKDVMLVVPAMEEAIDSLETMVDALEKKQTQEAEQEWLKVMDMHVMLMLELGLKPNEDVRIPLMPSYEDDCSYAQNYHHIVSLAAIMSSQIVAVSLLKAGVGVEWWNAAQFLLTQTHDEKLRLDLAYSEQVIQTGWDRSERKAVVVIPGGIGGTKEGKRTSFGSAGADLTAEMMKNFLKADQVEGILI